MVETAIVLPVFAISVFGFVAHSWRRRSGTEGQSRLGGQRGSALVEFAIVLPLLVMVLLGVVSGGSNYQRKLSMTSGAREGARYGATLPVSNFASLNAWLDDVAAVAKGAVDDGLGSSISGRIVCVAYVYPSGTGGNDRTTRRYETNSGVTYTNSTCFSDSRPSTERRVQVQLQRDSTLDAGVFRIDLTLSGKALARFEAEG